MALGLPSARVRCILALARATASGELPELSDHSDRVDPAEFEKKITQLPGIGPWTAQYILMRGLGWSDAFPESDLGLRKAMGGMSPARLRAAAERWRPWRAYAAQHLWASLKTVGSSGGRIVG
jgi:AraC family transcriptional regulator of adaptative response / DNA-3-methyladenine glycosylase II